MTLDPNLEPTLDNLDHIKAELAGLEGEDLIRRLHTLYGDQVAVLTSAGIDSAITLNAAAHVDPNICVLFGNTQKHFKQTIQHMELLKERFGLTQVVSPDIRPEHLERYDAKGDLHQSKQSLCCGIRKTLPLENYIQKSKIRVLVGGRMREAGRENIEFIEWDPYKNVLMVNPFAHLSRADAMGLRKDLPQHPLERKLNLKSVGCEPCTDLTETNGRASRFKNNGNKGGFCGLNGSDGADNNWRSQVYNDDKAAGLISF